MLRIRAGEVDFHGFAGDHDGGPDDQLAFPGLEHVGRLVAAVRELGDRGPDSPLRVGVQLVHRRRNRLAAPPLAELRQAPLGEPVRGQLRPQIAPPFLRVPHVGEQDGDHLVREPDGRDDEPFLEEVGRAGRQAGRLGPAHVRVVRAGNGETELGPRDERHVGEVRSAGEGIVDDEDIAELGPTLAHRRDGLRHRAQVNRDVLGLRDHSAVGREERRRAVSPLLDVGGERGADEHGAHLLRDRPERTAENLELDFHDVITLS